ncbi:hypothetical protein BKA82DRAFT_3942413, partial [Pisolithus tinctorius]
SLKDESNILYQEANVLYWAKALLKMMYKFIDHAIDSAKEPPPFDIPHTHFMDAGLLLVYSNALTTTKDSDGEDFMKYIHNGDAAPCDHLDPDAENIMQFLAFTQHGQYVKTCRQVYISDYQG